MSGRAGRGLGFGGAVGLGVAVSLLIAVIAVGHAVWHQLTGAVSLVITFGLVAVCVMLGGIALGALGLLVYGGQLGRLKLAERRIGLEVLARGETVRAELLDGLDGLADALDGRPVPAAIEPPRTDVSAYPRIDAQPHVVTSRAVPAAERDRLAAELADAHAESITCPLPYAPGGEVPCVAAGRCMRPDECSGQRAALLGDPRPRCPYASCHHNAPDALPAWRRPRGEAGRNG